MQISAATQTSSAQTTPTTQSDSDAITALEKKKAQLETQITKLSQDAKSSKDSQSQIQTLQAQVQVIDGQIQQKEKSSQSSSSQEPPAKPARSVTISPGETLGQNVDVDI